MVIWSHGDLVTSEYTLELLVYNKMMSTTITTKDSIKHQRNYFYMTKVLSSNTKKEDSEMGAVRNPHLLRERSVWIRTKTSTIIC